MIVDLASGHGSRIRAYSPHKNLENEGGTPAPRNVDRWRGVSMSSLVAITLLGFLFGMRHATDADHVIAVSTIVSRERSVGSAALIGGFWGVGHTLTIVTVGAGIIVFNLVIPPRLGLTMELAVGMMLVLLGVLNLTGVTRRITERFTPSSDGGHSHHHTHGDYIHSHVHDH